jgi:hypothetical protein
MDGRMGMEPVGRARLEVRRDWEPAWWMWRHLAARRHVC